MEFGIYEDDIMSSSDMNQEQYVIKNNICGIVALAYMLLLELYLRISVARITLQT